MVKSLDKLEFGEKRKIAKINAGRNATKRLYEMGLSTGSTFEVIKNDFGPIIISLYGNNIAIGRGLAQKIYTNN